jgi:hypothetical protein
MVMPTSVQVEDWVLIFFHWALTNSAIDSNAQLAGLSNVCKRWRSILAAAIVSDISANICLDLASDEFSGETSDVANHDKSSRREMLLLPSVVNRMIHDVDFRIKVPYRSVDGCRGNLVRETFCLAWFPSEGIIETVSDLSQNEPSGQKRDQEMSSLPPSHHIPSADVADQKNTDGSSDSCVQNDNISSSFKDKANFLKHADSPYSNCLSKICVEWRGYRSADEVLLQFGFAKLFIEEVLRAALALRQPQNNDYMINGSEPHYSTTCAVRGATVARPEQYCFCLDNFSPLSKESDDFSCSEMHNLQNRMGNVPSQNIKFHHPSIHDVSSKSEKVKIIELRRTFVPRSMELPAVPRSLTRSRRCVQFLNSSGSNAVCMVTPPFECGPIPEPITVLCVGVAVEDGCFMSSLNHPFEIGHNYPFDDVSKCTERSSICLATAPWTDDYFHPTSLKKTEAGLRSDSNEIESNEAGSSCYAKSCRCVFRHNISKTNQVDVGSNLTIHKGRLGPGSWHCYTGIFDGLRSLIRIDGIPEPTSHQTEFGELIDFQKNPVGIPKLDGLTIGSDHYFGMSLCCGNGSDGEGEGAISELAVFSGRLCEEDLYIIERNLMSKHGIIPSKLSHTLICKDDCLQRQAHVLMIGETMNIATGPNNLVSVPLSYVARHPSVAWQKQNPVTQRPISIHRIGQRAYRHAESSTDF